MRSEAVRLAGRCLGVAVASGMATGAAAQRAETALSVSTGIDAESNPYNQRSGGGSAAATAEIAPSARFRSENATLDLSGVASFRQFFRRYGLEDSYSGNAGLVARQSDRLTLRASASAAYSNGAYGGFGRPALSPGIGPDGLNAGAPLITGGATTAGGLPNVSVTDASLASQQALLTDATILGQRTRTFSFGGNAGFSAQISGRSTLSGDIGAHALRFRTGGLNDYDSGTAELSWSRSLDETSSVGLIGDISRTNYRAGRSGDTTTESALLSYDRKFSNNWAVSLAAGASFSDIAQPLNLPNTHLTSFNVRGRFCRNDALSQTCVGIQRSPEPSANGSVRVTNSAEADYTTRLSERERLTLSGSYTRTGRGQGAAALTLPAVSYANASARYSNEVGQRLSFYASGTVSRIYGSSASRRPNIGAALGVQFRFGAFQ